MRTLTNKNDDDDDKTRSVKDKKGLKFTKKLLKNTQKKNYKKFLFKKTHENNGYLEI
jgi:hypothetical protein